MPLGNVPLGDLPTVTFGGLLVLCRMAGLVGTMPALGDQAMPVMVRAALAGALTLLVAPIVLAAGSPPEPAPLAALRLIATEIATGMLIGWLAQLAAFALPVAGQLVSVATGLSSILQPDPQLGAQSSALARLFSLAVPVLLLSSGLYAIPIKAVAGSYELVRLGGVLPAAISAHGIVDAVALSFGVALRLAAPFLLLGTVWQLCVGVTARFVPSVQANAAILPGQVLGGAILLILVAAAMLAGWEGALRDALLALPGAQAALHG